MPQSTPVYWGSALADLQDLKHIVLICSHPDTVSFLFASHHAIFVWHSALLDWAESPQFKALGEQSTSLPEQSIFVHSRQVSEQPAGANATGINAAIIFKPRKRPEETITYPLTAKLRKGDDRRLSPTKTRHQLARVKRGQSAIATPPGYLRRRIDQSSKLGLQRSARAV